MFPFFHFIIRTARPVATPFPRHLTRRGISLTASRRATFGPEDDHLGPDSNNELGLQDDMPIDMELGEGEIEPERAPNPQSFREFLETIGEPFKYAKPRNWLGTGVVEFVLFLQLKIQKLKLPPSPAISHESVFSSACTNV